MSESALQVRDVRKSYATSVGTVLTVLDGVSLTLAPGSSAAIVGPSGSGKSTLLNILGTLDRADSGSIVVAGHDVAGLAGRELAAFRREHVGFVFQDHLLLPQCTAVENVLVPTLGQGDAGAAAERAELLLGQVGLADRADEFPDHLSGGERQRVAVARALIHRPSLLLCDEPTGNLDTQTADRVADLLFAAAAEDGVALVVVTHSLRLAERCGHVYRLEHAQLQPLAEGAAP